MGRMYMEGGMERREDRGGREREGGGEGRSEK